MDTIIGIVFGGVVLLGGLAYIIYNVFFDKANRDD